MFLLTFTLSGVQDNDFINISICSDAKGFQLRMTLLCDRQVMGISHLGELGVEQARQGGDLGRRG